MKPIEALFDSIPPREGALVNVIVDTPRGSGAKFKLDRRHDGFRLSHTGCLVAARLIGALTAIEHFFFSYNLAHGRRFRPTGRLGPRKAEEILDVAIRKYRQQAE